MKVHLYEDNPAPKGDYIFLAGPTIRGLGRTPWRLEAIKLLERHGFKGTVVVPEFRDQERKQVYGASGGEFTPPPGMDRLSADILLWETRGIESASVLLFWMPFTHRSDISGVDMPGYTTRSEVAQALETDRRPGGLVLGMPPGTPSASFIRWHAWRSDRTIHETLEATVMAALEEL